MKRIYSCIICANEANTASSKYCPECRPHVHAVQQAAQQVMHYAGVPPVSGKCVDCGAPAMAYDHRYYSMPLEVDPVCRYCNIKRGPALDVVEIVRARRGLDNRTNAPALEQQERLPSTGNGVDDAKRSAVLAALIRNKHNMAAAARDLGITYRAIRHYVKRWAL